MVNIRQDEAIKLKTKKALFVSFEYDLEKVGLLKTLPKRYYHPNTREWEVPTKLINALIELFPYDKINLTGSITSMVDKVAKTVKFDKVENFNFNFKTEPYDYQYEGFQWGLETAKGLLGDEQGLGKTKQAIDVAVARKHQFKHCLIVCGINGNKWNWLKEVGIHSDEKIHMIGGRYKKGKLKNGSVKERIEDLKNLDNFKDYFFLVTNVETLRNKEVQAELEKLTREGTIGMTVFDEVHKCSNYGSQQGKALHKLQSFYKLAMTGTPMINRPMDLYNVMKWLGREHHTFTDFRARYAIMGGYGGYQIVRYQNLDELQRKLQDMMLRRKKDDVLDLPPKIRTTEYVEMGTKQKKVYNEAMKQIKGEIDLIKQDPNPLSRLIRLRQATGYTGILSSSTQESAKIDRLEELIEEFTENGHKVIVYSNWEKTLTPAFERISEEFSSVMITGATKENPQDIIDNFQEKDDVKVIFGTVDKIGTGFTITRATKVIFLDSPWNPAKKDQAEDRAHRIGSENQGVDSIDIITLVTKDTMDERIEEIVAEKREIFEQIVDGKMPEVGKSQVSDIVDRLLS